MEFFVILFGLIIGFAYSRAFTRAKRAAFYLVVNHLKGLVVLGSAGLLAWLVFTGGDMDDPRFPLVLGAIVSFYFGSRS